MKKADDDDDLLTMPEVAEVIRLPLDTLRYMRHQGTAPLGFRVGRHVLFRRGAVRQWIREREEAGAR
jgi:excisionase family DNA binding protein